MATSRGISTRSISILSPGVKHVSGYRVSLGSPIKGVTKKNVSSRRTARKKRPTIRQRRYKIFLKRRMFVPLGAAQGPAIAPMHTHWG